MDINEIKYEEKQSHNALIRKDDHVKDVRKSSRDTHTRKPYRTSRYQHVGPDHMRDVADFRDTFLDTYKPHFPSSVQTKYNRSRTWFDYKAMDTVNLYSDLVCSKNENSTGNRPDSALAMLRNSYEEHSEIMETGRSTAVNTTSEDRTAESNNLDKLDIQDSQTPMWHSAREALPLVSHYKSNFDEAPPGTNAGPDLEFEDYILRINCKKKDPEIVKDKSVIGDHYNHYNNNVDFSFKSEENVSIIPLETVKGASFEIDLFEPTRSDTNEVNVERTQVKKYESVLTVTAASCHTESPKDVHVNDIDTFNKNGRIQTPNFKTCFDKTTANELPRSKNNDINNSFHSLSRVKTGYPQISPSCASTNAANPCEAKDVSQSSKPSVSFVSTVHDSYSHNSNEESASAKMTEGDSYVMSPRPLAEGGRKRKHSSSSSCSCSGCSPSCDSASHSSSDSSGNSSDSSDSSSDSSSSNSSSDSSDEECQGHDLRKNNRAARMSDRESSSDGVESTNDGSSLVRTDGNSKPHDTQASGSSGAMVQNSIESRNESTDYEMFPACEIPLPIKMKSDPADVGGRTVKPIKMFLKRATAKVLELKRSPEFDSDVSAHSGKEPGSIELKAISSSIKPSVPLQPDKATSERTESKLEVERAEHSKKDRIDVDSKNRGIKRNDEHRSETSSRSRSRSRHRTSRRRRSRSRSEDRRSRSRDRRSRDQHRRSYRYMRDRSRDRSSKSTSIRARRPVNGRGSHNAPRHKRHDLSKDVKVDPFGVILPFPNTRVPAGYCFVEFPDPEAANSALLKLNGKGIPGSKPHKLFKLNQASFGREHLQIPEYSLYVGELTPDVDDMALYNTFSKRYKSIRAAKVVVIEGGVSRGYGFVRFTSEAEQQLALIEMQHFNGLGKKPIRVSLAQPKKGAASSTATTPGTTTGSSSTPIVGPQPQHPYSQMAPPAAPEMYNQYNYYHQTPQQYAAQHQAMPAAQYWSDYTTQYYAYAPGAEYSADQYQPPPAEEYDPEDEVLEDPNLEIDVEKMNKEFMERSEEFYVALEGSRWHPLDNVFSTIVPTTSKT